MAVEIFKLEDGAVRSTYVEPHDLQNHIDNGWVLEIPEPEQFVEEPEEDAHEEPEEIDLEKLDEPNEPEVKREKLTLNPSHKQR